MKLRSRPTAAAALLISTLAVAACASPAPSAATPPVATEAPMPPPTAPEAAPSGTAEASKPPKAAPEMPKSSGQTPVLKSDPQEITDSFGSPPAKLELGETERVTLKIPENAFTSAVNLTFKIDKKGKSNGPPIGKIYRLTPVIPPEGEPARVDSAVGAFELTMPAGDRKDANLALGEVTTDENGKQKITWTVVAPVKIDDATATARFELKTLSDAYLHITTKAVTAPAP